MADPVSSERKALSPAMAISNRIVQMVAQYVGRGPTSARTTLNTNIAVVTLRDTMTRGERYLAAAGETESVRGMREAFHRSLREEAVKAVEEIMDRKIIAYLADLDPVSDVGMIAFVFETRPETNRVDIADVEVAPAQRSGRASARPAGAPSPQRP
jgi:uncharacterized protein YbcI